MAITDYYGLCEDGLVTVLQTLTDFFPDPAQVASAEDSEMTKGVQYYARVHPGAFPDTENISQEAFVTWEIVLDVFVKIVELKDMWSDFKALRAAIFWTLLQYPTLGGVAGIDNITLSAREKPKGIYEEYDDGSTAKEPFMITQELSINVLQRIAITGGEYA